MAVLKIACPKCGQKVSGDETFYGRSVNCPICTSRINFPQNPSHSASPPPHSGSSQPPPPAHSPPADPSPVPPAQADGHQPLPPADKPTFDSHSGMGVPQPAFDEKSSNPQYTEVPLPDEHAHEDVPSPLLGAVSLISGILNTVTMCFFGIILAPISIILGHFALAKAKKSPVKPAPGHSLAIIGVILGYTGLVFTILLLLSLLLFKEQAVEIFKSLSSGKEA